MSLRRGFKTEANELAVSLRAEMGLASQAPLSPWSLAEHLCIPILKLSDFEEFEPSGVRFLMTKGKELFSAVTLFTGRHDRKRVIVHNDAHSPPRRSANISHELAHAILSHAPTLPFMPDPVSESEAEWLGPTLLVPNEAALHILECGISLPVAQSNYYVSRELLAMRINVSGARIRLNRRRC